ncbi:hypothetical protein N8697_00700 [bacterium]|nr:hypothetical protein [bacterium]
MLGFHQAAIPDSWQVLGVKLRPLSLGHLILLHRYESAFVSGGLPTPADLVMSVLICSRTYEDSLDLVESGQFKREAKKLDKALRVCGDVKSRCEWFVEYLEEGLAGPKLWTKDGSGQNLGAPPEQVVKVALMSKLGLSETEVLNRPFSLSLWDIATLAEMNGTLKIYSEQDAELKEQAEELDKVMEEDKNFDPLKWRNN